MMKMYESNVEQLELLMVKEEEKHVPAKRVDIKYRVPVTHTIRTLFRQFV